MINPEKIKVGKGAGTWIKTGPNEVGGMNIMGNCDKCNYWPCNHTDLTDVNLYKIDGKEFPIPKTNIEPMSMIPNWLYYLIVGPTLGLCAILILEAIGVNLW